MTGSDTMSTLQFKNESESIPRLVVFKKSYHRPSLGLAAWEIVAPARGGTCEVRVPTIYGINVTTGGEEDPDGGCRSKTIMLSIFSGLIHIIAQPTDDRSGYVPDVVQAVDDVVENEIHIQNHYGRTVWGHLLLGEQSLYPPQLVMPGEVLMADARPSFWVAHIAGYATKGKRIVEGALSMVPTEMMPGQTLTVTGSLIGGFKFTLA
jgi:hypothetical protein